MELGIVGNYTCANRGDAAILRGLAEAMERPDHGLRLFSEQPDAGEFILGRAIRQTPLSGVRLRRSRLLLLHHAAKTPLRGLALRGRHIAPAAEALKALDALVFVGGSYFLDEYGVGKYGLPLLARALQIPFVLCGHSLGPFDNQDVRRLAGYSLQAAHAVVLRDETSLAHAARIGLDETRCVVCADTAWLTRIPPEAAGQGAFDAVEKDATVAVTIRRLAPFDKRLGIPQEQYESALASGLDRLIEKGLKIVGVAMCTGLGGYHMDDRMAAIRVRRLLKRPERMSVVMDELTDVELCLLLRQCQALIGTRMHSTILAMHVGTPALAIPYEHKSVGLFEKMHFPHRLLDVKALRAADLEAKVMQIVDHSAAERAATVAAANREQSLARDGVEHCLQRLGAR